MGVKTVSAALAVVYLNAVAMPGPRQALYGANQQISPGSGCEAQPGLRLAASLQQEEQTAGEPTPIPVLRERRKTSEDFLSSCSVCELRIHL